MESVIFDSVAPNSRDYEITKKKTSSAWTQATDVAYLRIRMPQTRGLYTIKKLRDLDESRNDSDARWSNN